MSVPSEKDLNREAGIIIEKIHAYIDQGKKVFATCSFQSQSLPLLHMISRVNRGIPVYYTNTGFLFSETIRFIDQVRVQLELNGGVWT